MTLSDIATFSSAISGIAVTASLIYLALQTHQNAKHTKALIQQGTSENTLATNVAFLDADMCAVWIEENGGTPTPEAIRRRQFHLQCRCLVNSYEDNYTQYSDGLISGERFSRICAAILLNFREPGFRAFWNNRNARLEKATPKFSAFMNGLAGQSAESDTPGQKSIEPLD